MGGCGSSQPSIFAFIEQGNASKVRDCIRAKADCIKEQGDQQNTPLHHACHCEPGADAPCVKALLEGGADFNATNAAKFTPLHMAACSGKAEAFKQLCVAGGKIEALDSSGQTPLHLAAQHGHAACIQAAIDSGVATNKPNDKGETMLHTAAGKGMEECVKVALSAVSASGPSKVEVNVVPGWQADGRTPLHVAALSGNKAIVEALVRAGANKEIKDSNGKVPMQLTQDRAIAELLQVVVMEEDKAKGTVKAVMLELPPEDESFKPVDDSTRRRIQDLVNSTWKSATTRDRGFEKVREFEVVQVSENKNAELLDAYGKRREEVALHLVNKLTDVKTAGDFDMGEEKRQENANEFFLFHGTNPSAARGICQSNFRVDLSGSNKGMLYGPGVYLAEASSKADEYAGDDKEGLYRGLYAMLLCRATLGNPVITEEVEPDVAALGEKLADDSHHCIVGDREKARGTYREFIVRDNRQVYPQYAIIYRRKET